MKRITAILIAAVFAFLACERIETRKEKYPSGNLRAKWEVTVSGEEEHKNGVYEEYYDNTKIKCIVNYVDDREHGVYRAYYENGSLQAEINYLEGLLSGTSKEFYDDGGKKRTADYKDGKLDGTVRTWDKEGNLLAQAKFAAGICKDGDCDKISAN